MYNGLGQLTGEYQATTGAVDTGSTPEIQYAYSDPSTGSRLVSMTYPNGNVLDYNYGTTGGLNDVIGRLDNLSEGGQTLEAYQYLGLSTVVELDHPETGVNLTYIQQPGEGNLLTDGGDQYTGLDRFGRVIDQNWYDTATSTSTDRYQYTYDADGNVTAKINLLDSSLSETYTYDSLNRLTDTTRGGVDYQSWTLDAVGNATSITTQGTTQDRTVNSQNELTSVGSSTLGFDNNGNTTVDDQGHALVYDAWNRLVAVKDSGGNTLAAYTYDALGRRVTETYSASSTTNNLYYSNQWQVIEERQNGTASTNVSQQYVWSQVYVDALLLRDSFTGGVFNQRLYAQRDANFNVTALVNTSGQVVERYLYDSYGKVTVLNPDWTVRGDGTAASSAYAWQYLHQGGRYDLTSGLYNFRNRDYSPTMQRWMEQDPAGYAGSGPDLYGYLGDNALGRVDAFGRSAIDSFWANYSESVRQADAGVSSTAAEATSAVVDYTWGALYSLANRMANATRIYKLTHGGVPYPTNPSGLRQDLGILPRAQATGTTYHVVSAATQGLGMATGLEGGVQLGKVLGNGFSSLWDSMILTDTVPPSPLGPFPSAAETTGTGLSTIRYTQEGETFLRYESGNPAFTRVTPSGGLQPGTFAAPASDGIQPVGSLNNLYNLPNPEIPRTSYFQITPPGGTAIIGPRSVIGGSGSEVIFPFGTPPGSAGPILPTPGGQ